MKIATLARLALTMVVLLSACDRSDQQSETISFPSNTLPCTEESEKRIGEWLEATAAYFDAPRVPTSSCFEMFGSYPPGPFRPREVEEFVGGDRFSGADQLVSVEASGSELSLTDDDRGFDAARIPRLVDGTHSILDNDAKQRRRASQDKPEGVLLGLSSGVDMRFAATLLSVLSSSDHFATKNIQLVIKTVAEDDLAFPDGVEPVPAALRNRIDQLVGDPCSRKRQLSTDLPLNEEFDKAMGECSADEDAFDEFVRTAPEKLAAFWASRRPSIWRECDCEPDIEFISVAQYYQSWDESYTALSVVAVTLSEDGAPLPYEDGETWQDFVDRLQEYHGEKVSIELPATAI